LLKKSTRKAMEEKIYSVFSAMDKTGANTKKYKELFSKMSDKEFEQYMVNMFNDHRLFLTLDMQTYKNEPDMETLEKAGKILGVSLYERVCYPHMSTDPEHPFVTRYEVPVGYIHLKRLQQMKRKKNSTSTNINSRDAKTGQVTGKDKNSRSSDAENYGMIAYGAKEAAKEFLSFRADDMTMKTEAYAQIQKNGFVDMADLTDRLENKKTLNTLNTYLICMGLMSDLVTPGYVLQSTIDDRELK